MAQSRLERIGTIYTRVTSLMKGGAMKPEDQPLWYPIYRAFPPKLEPRFDRAAPNIEINDIFYKEDIIRAKFQKDHGKSLINNLLNDDRQSHSLKFIELHQDLQKAGVPEAECYEKAVEELKIENLDFRSNRNEESTTPSAQLAASEKTKIKSSINTAELFKM